MPPELRAEIDALPPEVGTDPEPLLRHLVAVGLVTEERTGQDDDDPDLACHELVRERIRHWMSDHETDRANLTENDIRLAYAERLEAVFQAIKHQNMTAALQPGSRALVYCVQAGAWDRLGGFASSLVTSAIDPRLLESLLPHLEVAAESAPEGQRAGRASATSPMRWTTRAVTMPASPSLSRPPARLAPLPRPAVKTRA